MTVLEIIHKHMERYSVELQQKLEDLKRAYQSPTYGQAVIDVIRHQVQVLEARMDTLRDLEEGIQKEAERRMLVSKQSPTRSQPSRVSTYALFREERTQERMRVYGG